MFPTLPAAEKVTSSGAVPCVGEACAKAISGRDRIVFEQNAYACEPPGMLVPMIFTVHVPAIGFWMIVCSIGSTVFGPLLVAALVGLLGSSEYGKCCVPLGSISSKSRSLTSAFAADGSPGVSIQHSVALRFCVFGGIVSAKDCVAPLLTVPSTNGDAPPPLPESIRLIAADASKIGRASCR